jgi:hypothetical protein
VVICNSPTVKNNKTQKRPRAMARKVMLESVPGVFLGAIVGGLLWAVKFVQPEQAKDTFSDKLSFEPESFDVDIEVGQLFLKLQTYSRISEEDYMAAGEQVDKLFTLLKQLQQGEAEWRAVFVTDAMRYHRTAERFFAKFRDKATKMLVEKPLAAKNRLITSKNGGKLAEMGITTLDEYKLKKERYSAEIKNGENAVMKISEFIDQINQRVLKHAEYIHDPAIHQ